MNKKRKLLTEQLEDRRLLAGPYAPAAGQVGSTAIAHDDSAIISWATGYENYQPGSDVDPAFQIPENAIGKAEGTTSDAVTLGRNGQITLSFSAPIRNGFGSDFAIFENSFSDTFLELAYVEVSSDGSNFFRFQNDSLTSSPVGAFGEVDPTNVHNLAGKYRRGQGTPFDLEDLSGVSPLLNTAAITHVRVIDIVGDGSALDTSGDVIYDPSPTVGSAGFDLDGVGVLSEFEYSQDVVGFEDVGSGLETQSFFNGPDPDGTIVTGPYDDVVVLGKFQSELLTFNNAYSRDFDSWNQWAYSNMTDTTTAGYLNQFSAYPGHGADDSATVGIGFASQGDFYDAPLITRPADDLRSFGSLSVTNTTYAALSMLLGDSFAKKFGGDSGNDADFFRLSIEGLDASGQAIGAVDVLLADYQFADNSRDYILDDWVTVDLGPISTARSLSFSLTSSDVGPFGMNTPSYFAVDDIVMLTPAVAFDLQEDSVRESDGANATMARLSRAGADLSEPLVFTIEPVDASQAVLPSSVTIPAGANYVDFPIGVVDNSEADGDRELAIRVSAEGYTATEKSLQIRDDDPFRVSLDLSASEIAEGGIVSGTLRRNDAAPDLPLTIQLSASIDGRLSFASKVVMAAGQTTASFDIAAPEDDVDHRDVTVQIMAKASGYEDGKNTLFVLDNDTPKLGFTFSESSFSEQDSQPTEGFELLGRRLAMESSYNGADRAGQFAAGGLIFNNEYNPTFSSWGGWAYSNTTDVTTSGYLNQYSSFSGGGAVDSDTYLVGNAYPGFVVPRITRESASTRRFSTLDITNTTYAALSMYEGDSFGAKKFGGASGDDPDFFALTIEGLDVNDDSIGTVEVLLADFRFEDQDSDYILDAWTSVDLSSIGDANALTFSLLSSDIGQYGMNTPAYFALDNVKFEGDAEQPLLTVTRNAPDQTEDLLVQLYTSDYTEAVIQPTVVVPAGESTVDVPWEIIDDSVSDDASPVTFTALAEGYEFAQQVILVEDDDASVLTLTLSADEVDETSGSLVGLVHRNSGDLSFPLMVSLESNLAGILDFPSSVTIPAGQRSLTFDVSVLDNELIDGDRVVELVASKAGYESSSASVLVLDDDVEVTVSLSQSVVREIDSRVTIHAEDLGSRIASESADNGSRGTGGFSSGPVFLNNDYNPTFGSWSGWSVSNSTDVTTAGYLNQYSGISGSGAMDSSTYFVASAYGFPALPTITVSDDFSFDSFLVTNTTYAALSMQEGDAFAKKFGGETGDDPDYFLLTIEGLDSSSESIGTVEFYLADYRFADNSLDYLVDEWSLVDVSSLSSASSLVFSLTSSDVGDFGMNTPAYFALDQLVLSDSRPASSLLTVTRSDTDLGSPLSVDLSFDSTEVQLPTEVVIPAGSKSVEVPVYSLADGISDGDQAVSIVAAAAGHIGSVSQLTVEDEDASVLTLTLSADEVDETSGSLVGLVHRNSGDLSFPLMVSLESDLAGILDFPSSVTIPAGQRSLTFDVSVLDNELIDGDRVVELVASKAGYESSSASVLVLDDDVEVTVSLSQSVVREIDSRVTIHAEDLGSRIASESADNGSRGTGGFSSGPVFLNNDYNPTFGSWSGWSVSNSTDVTTAGYLNQYSGISGSGAMDSSTYFVASAYGFPALPTITVSDDFSFDSFLVTNTTYAALSMQEGDAFAKKFGGETGDDPDYFLLTIEGLDSSSESIGTVEFYLADYRFADNSLDYLVDEWSLVDVSSLSSASSLVFSLTSSDVGDFGMNTPAYFALDQLVLSDSRPASSLLTVTRSDTDLGSPLSVDLSFDSTEVQLPTEVVIPAGSKSVEVPVYSLADGISDGDQAVSIVAAAAGHIGSVSQLTVEDEDASVLTLTLSADEVDETSGSLVGLVHRNSGDLSFPLMVSLESNLAGILDFPSSVTIPAGQRSLTFDVSVLDNELIDGDRVVELVASKAGYESSSASVLVLDDDVEVTVSLSQSVVREIDSRVTIHAEDLGSRIASESADNGSRGTGGFSSGPVFLNNDYNPTFGSWSGWSVSNSTDVTTAGYLNQYSGISGSGAMDSSTYFVASAYGFPALPTITVSDDFSFDSFLVTNTTYAALSMQEGDAFAKKFGGETGDDPDYFLLTIEGLDSSSESIGTVEFYLADYRFADNSLDYLVDEWSLVDVSSLSSASSLVFSLTSSDVGDFGMNTPAYFALDQLVLSDSRPASSLLTVTRSDTDLGSPLSVDLSFDSTEVQLPTEVVIPAGSKSVEVPVYSLADGISDGDQAVSIVAAAAGHIGSVSQLTVEDEDASVLTLTLSADEVDETSGSLVGLVHRNSGDLSFPLMVSLESDLAGILDFPSSVTIPAGQRSLTFDVSVLDNELIDGDRVVELVASKAGYESSSGFVVSTEATLELLGYVNGRVRGFGDYVLEKRGDSTIEVDLNSLDQFAGSGATGDLTVSLKSSDQLAILGDAVYGSPKMVDGRFAQVIDSDNGRLQVISERPWQNVMLNGDANHDSEISVVDALAVLNHLATFGAELSARPVISDFRGTFPDVSGDNFTTAFDALLILNQLALVGSAEGEAGLFPVLAESQDWSAETEVAVESLTIPKCLPEKLVAVSHPADQAILELYSPPAVADDGTFDDAGESGLKLMGADWM